MTSTWKTWGTALTLGASLLGVAGCELATAPDRSKIKDVAQGGGGHGDQGGGGHGGTGQGGGGGHGGSDQGGGGHGGTSCKAPTDCPPPGSECVVATCTNGVCGTDNVKAGTPTGSQTAGDCKQKQCDGSGAVTTVNDDTDLPNDNNECTDDACTMGVPSHKNRASGSACTMGGLVCDGSGACVGCTAATDCPGQDDACKTRTCTSNVCGFSFAAANTALPAAQQTAGDCQRKQCDGSGAIVSVPDDADLPNDHNECTTDVCTSGVPSHPPTMAGSWCSLPDGGLCDGAGVCVQCLVDTDCPSLVCMNHVCQAPTCMDHVLNGDETGVDCGGSICPPCP